MVERGLIRYTPAGLPALNFSLVYRGDLSEAGQVRQLELELPAVALGDIALTVDRIELGKIIVWEGFLAHKNRRSKQIEFHIVRFEQCTEA